MRKPANKYKINKNLSSSSVLIQISTRQYGQIWWVFCFLLLLVPMFYLILKKRRNICQKNGESYCLFIFLHLNFRKADLDWRLTTTLDSMSGYSEDHLREKLIKVFHLSSSAADPVLFILKREVNCIYIKLQDVKHRKWAVFQIHKVLGLPDPLVRGTNPNSDPDPPIIKQK